MSFLYPLGLLGLIGVLVLILIYIIKSKYKEYTIASTYIWELSEKFMQKKNPVIKNYILSSEKRILKNDYKNTYKNKVLKKIIFEILLYH